MELLYIALILFPLLLFLSMGMTRLMIGLAPKLGLMDQPAARRIHVTPVPRAGGIAVFVTLLVGIAVLRISGVGFNGMLGDRWLACFLLAASLLVGIGIADDRKGLSALFKLGVQVVASVIMFFERADGAGMLFGFQIPWIIDLGIHVAWYVALINAFNLIDGMDGLCAGLGMISMTILAIITLNSPVPESALVIGVMIFALLGFLRYNFHPARIFLGDTGSMLIGFFIASVGAATVGKQAVVTGLLLPLLVAGVPLFDVFLAIWRRLARRIATSRPGQVAVRVFDPDRDHLHHRLLRWGLTQRQTALALYSVALLGSLLALVPFLGGVNLLSVAMVGLIVIGIVGLRYIAPIEFLETGEGLRAVIRRPQPVTRIICYYFLYDLTTLALAGFASSWMVSKVVRQPWMLGAQWSELGILVACAMVGLRFGRAHVRRWMRAGKHDFAEVGIWLTCGFIVSYGLQSVADADFSYRNLVFHLLAMSLSAPLILLPRCVAFALQESVVDSMHRKRRMKSKMSRRTTLLYGAGDLGELFLSHLRLSPPSRWKDYHFVGFLDDVPELKGRRMRGFPIMGGLADLDAVAGRCGVNCIIVTSSVLPAAVREDLMNASTRLGLEIQLWNPSLDPVLLTAPLPEEEAAPETESAPVEDTPEPAMEGLMPRHAD